MEPAATYDIETADWTTFVVGAIHYADGRTEVYWHDDHEGEARMARALAGIDGEVYAHNGGKFDHLWALDTLDEPAEIIPNSSGIVSLKFRGSPATFCDSIRIFPYRLALLTGGAKGDISHLCRGGHEDGKKCKGFCAIRREGMTQRERREVQKYLVADVVELMRALRHHAERAREWGFAVKRTLGSTSWHAAEGALGIEPTTWPEGAWELARSGYHGGRAEMFFRSAPRGWRCDVNSMYPWALTRPLPVGVPVVKYGADAKRAWKKGAPGIYHASVSVPRQHIPPLPMTIRGGLVFPWGRFIGHWPRPELESAIEHYGVEVRDVHGAVVWQEEREIFARWIGEMYDRRAAFGKESQEGRWLKWLCNSLTGKMGTRNVRRRIKVRPDPADLRLCRCPRFTLRCTCGGWRPRDPTGKVWESVIENCKPERCSHPEWAAYLTGYARMRLQEQLVACDDAIYCDTDSCWSFTKRENLGDGLGEWADEGRFRDFEALGPKAYHAWIEKKGVWEELTRLKGVPEAKWGEVKAGVPQVFGVMRGLRRANGGKFFVRDLFHRKARLFTGSRIKLADSDPRTYPIEFA